MYFHTLKFILDDQRLHWNNWRPEASAEKAPNEDIYFACTSTKEAIHPNGEYEWMRNNDLAVFQGTED